MSMNPTKIKVNSIASQIHPKVPTNLGHKKDEKGTVAHLQQAMQEIHSKRSASKNAYEQVISALQQVIEDLFNKNDCLTQEKQFLIKQNYELKKQTQSLTNIIEVKKRLGESIIVDNTEIFQIMVESNSVQRGFSKYQDSYECGNTIGNILEENSCIANRQQFIIMSNPLSQNVSQTQQNQISMSNIGRTQQVHNTNLQTPGLYQQNIYVQCNSRHPDAVIRSFYLSVMQKRSTLRHLIDTIESLRNDITTIVFQPYPTNQFWVQMLCNFLKIAHDGHFDTQLEVLQYIKIHRLIDSLMVKCLKSRIEFLFYNNDCFQMPTVQEILRALANQFGLRMETNEDQYIFYTKEVKDENLLSSDPPSLEISLNNKNENIFYIKEEEPCFTILERQDTLQFTFFITIEPQLGISQYQINEDSLGRHDSFRCSGSKNQSIHLAGNQFQLDLRGDHLDGVASVLNERDVNSMENSGLKHSKPFGHRRYVNDQKENRQVLNSSRFFLNRVASKHSSFDQNA